MGFGEAVKSCFTKYATFKGRAPRSEYWYFFLANWIVSLVVNAITGIVGRMVAAAPGPSMHTLGLGIVNLILDLIGLASVFVFVIPGIAVTVRRLHDVGRSGWWYLAILSALVLMAGTRRFGSEANLWVSTPVTLISLGALIWFLVWMCRGGTTGPNRYGPDPLAKDGDFAPAESP